MKALLLSAVLALPPVTSTCAHPRVFDLKKIYTTSSIDTEEIERTEDLEDKLKLVADAKSYGVQVFGLEKSKNYLRYRLPGEARTVYWLLATPKAEVPKKRSTSISLSKDGEYRTIHKGSFRLSSEVDKLLDEEQFYKSKGFDVYRRSITDFYDGKGCDLTPDFLDDIIVEQAGTVFHEDWHHSFSTWNKGKSLSSEINESAGALIEYAGGMEFMEYSYGEDSRRHKNAVNRFNHRKKTARIRNALHKELTDLYEADIPKDKKIKQRQEIFTKYSKQGYSYTNASLWDNVPYDKHFPLMVKVYKKAGSVKEFVDVMKKSPVTEKKAITYLQNYLSGRQREKR